jgi:hypothetical protein
MTLLTMIKRGDKRRSTVQRGYAMLGIIAAVGVATTAVVVTSLSATAVRNEQGRRDSNALALAKQALIASAASSNSRPGSLPCPDVDNDGLSDQVGNNAAAACTHFIGRLPWQTLGLPDLRDAAGERLWYAVSENFQDISANRINASTVGQLIVREGEQTTTGVVAIVTAPGRSLGSQRRDTAQVNSMANYLEGYSADTLTATLHAPDTAHNDQLAVVTPADIFSLVERRVAKEVQNSLQNYYLAVANPTPHSMPYPAQTEVINDGNYSYPASVVAPPFSGPVLSGYLPSNDPTLVLPAWFSANRWYRVFNYRVDSNCVPSAVTAATGTCGTTTFTVSSYGVLLGGTAGVPAVGTMAMLGFNGVSTAYTNFQSTLLNATVQAQVQTQTQTP